MDSANEPRNVAKEQYATMRQSLVALEERVAGRYWEKDTPIRMSFERLLGSMDRLAGWLFADNASRPAKVLPLRPESLESAEADKPVAAEQEQAATEEQTGHAPEESANPPAAALDEPAPDEPAASTVDVTFTLPAEVEAESVTLCGEFNQWSHDDIHLGRDDDGTWRATVPLEPGRSYRYRYLLDHERWENARQADSYVPNPYGGVDSVVIVGSPPDE
jgi:hypothetical protein